MNDVRSPGVTIRSSAAHGDRGASSAALERYGDFTAGGSAGYGDAGGSGNRGDLGFRRDGPAGYSDLTSGRPAGLRGWERSDQLRGCRRPRRPRHAGGSAGYGDADGPAGYGDEGGSRGYGDGGGSRGYEDGGGSAGYGRGWGRTARLPELGDRLRRVGLNSSQPGHGHIVDPDPYNFGTPAFRPIELSPNPTSNG